MDDKLIKLEWPDWNKKRIGQLLLCNGSTCGNKEKGAIEVPVKKIKNYIKKNDLKTYFKVTETPCLGVCKPHNVISILSKDEQIWLGMIRDEEIYNILLEWIKTSVNDGKLKPLPEKLIKHRFDRFEI